MGNQAWRIVGRDDSTGDDVTMTIEATTQESAVRRAGRRGVRVMQVAPIVDSVDEPHDDVGGGYVHPPRYAQPSVVHHHHHDSGVSGGVAALLSLLIPGVGQMVNGKVGAGIVWLIGTFIGYLLFIVPGLILHIICIVDAANSSPQRRQY
ncbi:MAG: hypothetical protein AAGI46_16465 [Planctomycetota bacterium]